MLKLKRLAVDLSIKEHLGSEVRASEVRLCYLQAAEAFAVAEAMMGPGAFLGPVFSLLRLVGVPDLVLIHSSPFAI